MRTRYLIISILFLIGTVIQASDDDLVLVVHPASEISTISKSQLINIYMGKFSEFPRGHKVSPLETDTFKGKFYRKLIKKSLPQLNAYWSRIKFTGRAENRPEVLRNHELVIARIATDKNALGYIQRKHVRDNLKIVYELN